MMTMRSLTTCLALSVLACGLMARPQLSRAAVFIAVAPPAPIVEVVPPVPRVGYVWAPGYWRWNGRRYVWARGAYVVAPRVGAVFVPAHWVARRRGWVFVRGRWR